jgi:hypothetical protein
MWREEACSEVASVLPVVVAMNRPFERIFILHLLERRRVLVVGVALSLYELRMLVDWRSGLGESVALSLHELHVLSSAKARVGAVDEAGRWTPKDACCCAMSCKRVSIFVKHVFFNLAKLGTTDAG